MIHDGLINVLEILLGPFLYSVCVWSETLPVTGNYEVIDQLMENKLSTFPVKSKVDAHRLIRVRGIGVPCYEIVAKELQKVREGVQFLPKHVEGEL